MTAWGFQPDVVGVTGYSMHVLRNLSICAAVKKVAPDCRTVVGGHHATLLPEDFFEPQIDFVVCGEGGRAFRAILRGMEQTPFFQKIRSDMIPTLYNQPDLWMRFGYEVPSAEYGGYIDRGFNDIDWLPA